MKAAFPFAPALVSAFAIFALGLTGCPAGPTYIVQQYGGPPRARETIATLRVNGKDKLPISTLDGEEITAHIAEDTRLHIELLPGRHLVSVRTADVNIAFLAQPGKVYRVVIEGGAASDAGPTEASPHIHEVDRESDALGVDVTETKSN